MSGLGLLFFQAVAASAQPAATPPDIEIVARVTAREVKIESQGTARIALRAEPGEAPPVKVTRSAPPGAQKYRNLTIELRAEARLTQPTTASPQQGNEDDTTEP